MKHSVAPQQVSTYDVGVHMQKEEMRGRKIRNHMQSDGGMHQSGINDDNNCTIRAFAIAYCMPYKDAYYMGELAGRPHGKGYWMHKIMDKAKEFGYDSVELETNGSLSAFLKNHHKGRFICVRKGHAFAIIDGKIYDTLINASNCKLIHVYNVQSKRKQLIRDLYAKHCV